MHYGESGSGAMTTDEATYACTTCGLVCVVCVMFGLLSNEFPDEFNKTDERAVWVILLMLVVLGSVWSVLVVEPVVGIMQEVPVLLAPLLLCMTALHPSGGRFISCASRTRKKLPRVAPASNRLSFQSTSARVMPENCV